MKLLRQKASRRLLAWLAVLGMAFPAAAYLQRVTILFQASFDVSSSPGSGALPAEVGQFGVVSEPAEFSLATGSEGGELKIDDSGTAGAAILDAHFKKPFKGEELTLEWTVEAMQTDAKLIVSAQDAGDTGLIDCTTDGDGTVDVDGQDTGYTYEADKSYRMSLTLKSPLAGTGTWTLTIQTEGKPTFQATGPFVVQGDFTAKALRIARPANDVPGEFLIDDILVSTFSYAANY
jgi:hypothetical protein